MVLSVDGCECICIFLRKRHFPMGMQLCDCSVLGFWDIWLRLGHSERRVWRLPFPQDLAVEWTRLLMALHSFIA